MGAGQNGHAQEESLHENALETCRRRIRVCLVGRCRVRAGHDDDGCAGQLACSRTNPVNPNGLPVGIAIPAIPVGNHYVCYPVRESTQFTPRVATFHDEFGTFTATVQKITHLCNPALKRADGKVYEMVNPNMHLTCYAITYQGPPPPPVITNDQFGPRKLYLAPPTTVCLPAGKVITK